MARPRRFEFRLYSAIGLEVPRHGGDPYQLQGLNELGAEGWHVVATLVETQGGEYSNSTGYTTTASLLLEREILADEDS